MGDEDLKHRRAELEALEKRLKELRGKHLPPPPRPTKTSRRLKPLDVSCPVCGGGCEQGVAYLTTSAWGLLVGGAGLTTVLRFRGGREEGEDCLGREKTAAARCSDCGTLVLRGRG